MASDAQIAVTKNSYLIILVKILIPYMDTTLKYKFLKDLSAS